MFMILSPKGTPEYKKKKKIEIFLIREFKQIYKELALKLYFYKYLSTKHELSLQAWLEQITLWQL